MHYLMSFGISRQTRQTCRFDHRLAHYYAQEAMEGASVDAMKRWVKNIFTLNNIVDFSSHSCQTGSIVKQRTWTSTLTICSNKVVGKTEKTFLYIIIKS